MTTKHDLAPGYIVGTIHEQGRCEHCSVTLKKGDRAALWNPTLELFCVRCAKMGIRPERTQLADLLITIILVVGLMLTLVLGLAK